MILDKLDKEKIPKNYYSIPDRLKQTRIFLTRDLLSKLTNKQYILISLLESPVLAVILGFFTKQIEGNSPGKAHKGEEREPAAGRSRSR